MHRTELLPVAADLNIRAGAPAAGVKNSSVQLASGSYQSIGTAIWNITDFKITSH